MWTGHNIYWGDLHGQIPAKDIKVLPKAIEDARKIIDFWGITLYPFSHREIEKGSFTDWGRGPSHPGTGNIFTPGLALESWGPRGGFQEAWRYTLEQVAGHDEPGRFVLFGGYEWHGDRSRYGDHNVFYRDLDGKLYHTESLVDLYKEHRTSGGIAIPHHTAYKTGYRGKDWSFFDEEVSPLVEIYSSHGSSEGDDCFPGLENNTGGGPFDVEGSVQRGLALGRRFGFIGSTDLNFAGAWGAGRTACYAKTLDRDSLWDALISRRTYAVTGDKIKMLIEANDSLSGSVLPASDIFKARVVAEGTCEIDKIELIKNNRVIDARCLRGTWEEPNGHETVTAKIKIECGWGPRQWQHGGVPPHSWSGKFRINDGRIISVEKCWTMSGQEVERTSQREYAFRLRTDQNPGSFVPLPSHRQALIFEVEMRLSDTIEIVVDNMSEVRSLEECLAGSKIMGDIQGSQEFLREKYGITIDELDHNQEDKAIYWTTAYKAKIHRAYPSQAYAIETELVDPAGGVKGDYYYVRLIQVNAQMAWVSPFFIG